MSRQIKYSQTYSWQPYNFLYPWYNSYLNFKERLYYLALDTKPILVLNRTFTGTDHAWVHSDIVTNSSGTFLYEELVELNTNNSTNSSGMWNRIVNASEISKELAYFN